MNHRAAILSILGTWALLDGGAHVAHAQPQPPDTTNVTSPVSDDGDDNDQGGDDTGDGAPIDDSASGTTDGADATGVPPEPEIPEAPDDPATREPMPPDIVEPAVKPPPVVADADEDHTLIEEDVQPTVVVYKGAHLEMRLGGLVQVHFAPYVGNRSQVNNDDLATNEGFRLRRARLGVEGKFRDDVSMLLVVNPLESDPDVGSLSSARLTVTPIENLNVNIGTDSVPFTRAELDSSKSLSSIERPLVARTIVPSNRLGVTVEGLVANRVAYVAGVLNATPGYEEGNRFGGFMYAARLQVNAIGAPSMKRTGELGVAVSLGGLYQDGSAVRREGASADVFVTAARASAKIELVCDRSRPQDAPKPAPTIADRVERCGGYVELAYTFPEMEIQPVVRAEFFDDDRNVEDAGDSLLFSIGVNARLLDYTRVQLHYLSRRERNGDQLPNDAVVMNLQGEF